MTDEMTFEPLPASVPGVRRFVLANMGEVPAATRDRVGLMVSELATNAVLHSATAFRVRLERAPDRLLVSVADKGEGAPVVQAYPLADEPHGRGLLIVSQLADEWGVTPADDGVGKAVWFAVDLESSTGLVRSASRTQRPSDGGATARAARTRSRLSRSTSE
ncbi:MAG: ATP-binding protein [Acidimicrobiales bacterium]